MRSVQRTSGKRSIARRRASLPIATARAGSAASSSIAAGERVGVARLHEQAGLAVAHEVLEAADRGGDHGPRPLHRLERDHAEALAERRHDDGERLLDRALHRRDVAEEPHGAVEPELAREILEPVLEHAAARDLERRVGPLVEHLPERAQQHDVALDRDQAADAEEARRVAGVRRRARRPAAMP